MRRLGPVVWAAAVLALVPSLSSCSRDGGTLEVYAASSLTDAFTELAAEVRFVFAGSDSIVRQVLDGAPADVVATADHDSLNPLADRLVTRQVFVRNRLTIVTEPGNPLGVRGPQDLSRVKTVLCAPEVPCGRLTQRLLSASGVDVSPVSLEPNVRSALAKVTGGEADAAVVYRSDARQAETAVSDVPLPLDVYPADAIEAEYPIGIVDGNKAGLARRWISFITSPSGRAAFAARGFVRP
jgi:molybdate transport system substrate-binding protein